MAVAPHGEDNRTERERDKTRRMLGQQNQHRNVRRSSARADPDTNNTTHVKLGDQSAETQKKPRRHRQDPHPICRGRNIKRRAWGYDQQEKTGREREGRGLQRTGEIQTKPPFAPPPLRRENIHTTRHKMKR